MSKTLIQQLIDNGGIELVVDLPAAKPARDRKRSERRFRITNRARSLICEIISAA